VPDLAAIPGVRRLWELTRGERDIRLAIVDGPADLSHPCFEGAHVEVLPASWLAPEIEVLPDYPDLPERRLEHGTWVSSVLFGSHDSDVPGLAPGCAGLLVPCLRGDASDLDAMNVAHAIDVAAVAHVIVVELCIPSRSGDVNDVLKRAIANAVDIGVLVIASSGNEHALHSCFPAASPDVLAVGAYDDDGRVYGFSNWGAEYEGHGLVAPGGNIKGAIPGGGTKVHKGTSCSAPVVAGVAGLLLSLQARMGATPDPPGVRRALLQTAAPCSLRGTGGEPRRCIAGRLDVDAATDLVLSELRSAGRAGAGARGRRAGALRHASPGVMASASDDGFVPPAPGGSLVFALGAVGFDFGSVARRDAFARAMGAGAGAGPGDADDERAVLDHLVAHPLDAATVLWTLSLDRSPLYAIMPVGPYAAAIYEQLVRLTRGQRGEVERVSLPGQLTDARVELESGEVVPVVAIDSLRGLHGLDATAIADAAAAHVSPSPAGLREALRELLTRIYVDLANAGCTSAQRALNFAITNAYQLADSVAAALARDMVLDTVDTERSAICRQDSDCWDVRLRFFDPENSRRARKVFRFTIDVSDILPVTLGEIRGWSEPATAIAA